MISAEPNSFDKYLKEHLPREAFAKICLRTIISLLMLLLAGIQPHFSFYDHFSRTADSIDMPIKILAPFITILFICALMFKDLEHALPEEWSQETSKGSLGAFVRSIAAEFLIWMASIFVSLAITMVILLFVIPSPDMTINLFAKIAAILVNLTGLTFFFVVAYLLVKRIQPPLADSKKFTEKFRTSRSIVAFYCATALITLIAYASAYI